MAQQRWHRPVAWVLAVIMGVSLVAVAVAAIYQGVGGSAGAPRRPESGSSSPGTDPRPAPAEPSLVVTAPAGDVVGVVRAGAGGRRAFPGICVNTLVAGRGCALPWCHG